MKTSKEQLCKKIKNNLIKHFGKENIEIIPSFSFPETRFRMFFKNFSVPVFVDIDEDIYDYGDLGFSEPFLTVNYGFERVSVDAEPGNKESIDKAIHVLLSYEKRCSELNPILKKIIHV